MARKEPVAGASAKAIYADLRKGWLRRTRRYFLVLAAILIVAVGLVTWLAVVQGTFVGWWIAGMGFGVALAAWVLLRDSPPPAIENWLLGSWGEEATGKALRRLPSEWQVRHDIDTGAGNIDHLVVGPGGVFVVETKKWSGVVRVEEHTAYVRMPGRTRADVRERAGQQVRRLARSTHDRVRAATRISLFVVPVVVVWGDFEQRVVGDAPAFVAGDALVEWLTNRPVTIAEARLFPDHRGGRCGVAARGSGLGAPGRERAVYPGREARRLRDRGSRPATSPE